MYDRFCLRCACTVVCDAQTELSAMYRQSCLRCTDSIVCDAQTKTANDCHLNECSYPDSIFAPKGSEN